MEASRQFENEEKLFAYEGEDRIVSSVEYMEEEAKNEAAVTFSISTTFPRLKELVFSGFRGGELITITGPSGQGKTLFANMLTKQFEEQGIMSAWFSYEVGASELIREFSKSKLFYLPRQMEGHSVKWLEDRIMEAKLKHPEIGAIFIDTLDEVVSLERPNNYVLETEYVVSEIKQLAIALNMPIFQIAHLSKAKQYDAIPTEIDIKNSSAIYQKSDKVLMVWREREKNRQTGIFDYTGRTLVIINKNRQKGSMMNKWASFHFNDETTELVEDAEQENIVGLPSLSRPMPAAFAGTRPLQFSEERDTSPPL